MNEEGKVPRSHLNPALRIILAVLMAFGIFILSSAVVMTVATRTGYLETWFAGAMQHASTLIICFLVFLVMGARNRAFFGFRLPVGSWLGPGLMLGTSTGIISTLAAIWIPGTGMEFAGEYLTWQLIIFIWFLASFAEEILYRGLIQSFLSPLAGAGISIAGIRLSIPVIVAALVFGLGHIVVLTMGVGIPSVVVIVLFATFLGLVAGYYRERTGSILPAIIIHMAGNIGGSLAAWLMEVMG